MFKYNVKWKKINIEKSGIVIKEPIRNEHQSEMKKKVNFKSIDNIFGIRTNPIICT